MGGCGGGCCFWVFLIEDGDHYDVVVHGSLMMKMMMVCWEGKVVKS